MSGTSNITVLRLNIDSGLSMLNAQATLRALPFRELVMELRAVVLQLEGGHVICPERLVVPMAAGGLMLSMPAVADDIAVHKLITVTPGNAARGLPTIHGLMSVLDARTGQVKLILDGPTVTGRRTAAMSMLGLDSLLAHEPKHILLIGTGTQSLHHVEAIAALYPATHLSIRGSSTSAAERFCQQHRHLHAALSADEGAEGAEGFDVVITCTTSRLPVYTETASMERLVIPPRPSRADAAEIGSATVRGSAVYVDDAAGARHEAGDLIRAGINWNSVLPLAHALREGVRQAMPLLFKTVGCAAWDLAAARVALKHEAGTCPPVDSPQSA